jgi:CheY-like chemotaxis protein
MKKIAVVDDDIEIAEIVKDFLVTGFGRAVDVTIFDDSSDFYKICYTKKENWDLLICDYKMPKYDGLALLEKTSEYYSNGILISAYLKTNVEEEFFAKWGIFDKPIDMKIFNDYVRATLWPEEFLED